MTDLSGRHALITGGGTGIGAAIALAMANNGARVTITGRRIEPLESVASQSENIRVAVLDVTEEEATVRVFSEAKEAFGPLGIVVANAGIAETMPIMKSDLAFWRRTMATNLDGAFLTMRAGLPDMLENGWGRVIAVSSIAGQKGLARGTAYCASKHGLIGLTRALSAEFIGKGITVNALCPGYVRTPIIDRGVSNIMEKTGLAADKALKAMVDANPIGRLIEPEEVAAAALYLCGSGSEAFNGQTVQLAGGDV